MKTPKRIFTLKTQYGKITLFNFSILFVHSSTLSLPSSFYFSFATTLPLSPLCLFNPSSVHPFSLLPSSAPSLPPFLPHSLPPSISPFFLFSLPLYLTLVSLSLLLLLPPPSFHPPSVPSSITPFLPSSLPPPFPTPSLPPSLPPPPLYRPTLVLILVQAH